MARNWKDLDWKRFLECLLMCYQKTQNNIERYDDCKENEAIFDVSEIAGYVTGDFFEGLINIGLVESYWIHVGEGSVILSNKIIQWMKDNQDIAMMDRDYTMFDM